MDKETWIVLGGMVLCLVGAFLLTEIQDSPSPAPSSPAVSSSIPAAGETDTQNSTPPAADTNSQDCQSIATAAAQSDQAAQGETTSMVEAYFNQTSGQCYYEVDIFTSSGNETDLRLAPDDQVIASCTTTAAGTLSCQKQNGASITEPQFKALLANDIPN